MNQPLKSFVSFSRTERLGLIALLSLLIILIAIRTTMHFWVKPDIDEAQQQKLVAAWQQFKQQQKTEATYLDTVNKDFQDRDHAAPLPAIINLNTADSTTLVRLKGIGPVLTHKILERRKQLGHFTAFSQLLQIPRFPSPVYQMLKKHSRIDIQ